MNAPLHIVRPMEPRPTELDMSFGREIDGVDVASEALIDEHRHLDCKSYDACLHVAVVAKWKNWTCSACPLRVAKVKSPGISMYDGAR